MCFVVPDHRKDRLINGLMPERKQAMTTYTTAMRRSIGGISFEDEDFIEKIIEVGKQFRPFSEAMDDFIAHHGYDKDIHDVKSKVEFINNVFKAAEIQPPRNVKKWYEEGKLIKRDTAYQICFAFGLDATETDDFFRRYYASDRGFDCHLMEDAVYYCCMLNGWTYTDAQEIITQVGEEPVSTSDNIEVVYTESIIDDLKDIVTKEDLISYLSENRALFSVNNITAFKTIQDLWNEIVAEDGLLVQENRMFYSIQEDRLDKDIRISSDMSASDVFIALFQLDREPASRILEKYKSIGPILKNLHQHIQKSFPNEQAITRILRNDYSISYEPVRKWLILLSFYTFWAKKSIKSEHQDAGPEDRDRCVVSINKYLVEAGYSELYEGNPYDWLFFYAIADVTPLPTFRWIWQALLDKMQEEASPNPVDGSVRV